MLKNCKMPLAVSMTQLSSYHLSADKILEEEILIRAAQNDPKKFAPLYTNYFERIANFIYSRVDDKEISFDLTSAVFYKALDNIKKYRSQGVPFSAWLFRIASNEVNQYFRKNKTQRTISINNSGLAELKSDIEDNSGEERDKYLYEALQELEENEMELISMRFFEQRSFKEISEISGSGESACKMKLYRILDVLKKKLNHLINQE